METWQIVLVVLAPITIGLLWTASIMWVKRARITRTLMTTAICMLIIMVAVVVPLQQVNARNIRTRNSEFTEVIDLFREAYTPEQGSTDVISLDRLVRSTDTYYAFWTEEGEDTVRVSILCEGIFGNKWHNFGSLTTESPEE